MIHRNFYESRPKVDLTKLDIQSYFTGISQ